jgi:hypothetical protein
MVPYARVMATAAMVLTLAGVAYAPNLRAPDEVAASARAERLPPANTIEGAIARSPLRQARAAAAGAQGDRHFESQLAAVFRARGVRHFTPKMIRDIALAEIKTGTPAGVLSSISEREFSHNTVRIAGSIPGTVSSRGYFSAFAFKPASWDYYKYELWGDAADRHDPFDYGDAAMVAGTILQHYRQPGVTQSNRIRTDPLGSLQDYNANYAAGVLKDAEGKYASPLWRKLTRNLKALQAGGQVEVIERPKGVTDEELLLRGLRMRIELFLSGIPEASG